MKFRFAYVVPVVVLLVFASEVHGRIWTDRSGEFKIEAELLDTSNGKVRLKKNNGNKVTVPIEKLSEADQAYLKQLAQAKEPATTPEPRPSAWSAGHGESGKWNLRLACNCGAIVNVFFPNRESTYPSTR